MKKIKLQNPDASTNSITIFEKTSTPQTPIIILFPAMGVRASFYESFAEKLAEQDYIAVTADLRGHGASSVRPSKKVDFGYKEMIEQDYTTIIQTIKTQYPNNPLHLLGHSLGGQLACLYTARHPKQISSLILIACCSVYYKGWTGIQQPALWLMTQFFGRLARVLGYFPGKRVGFGGLESKTTMIDWSHQARTGQYILTNDDFDYEKGLKNLDKPILAISFASDNFAPKKAVQHLLQKFKSSDEIKHQYLPKEMRFNHFNWVKKNEAIIKIAKRYI